MTSTSSSRPAWHPLSYAQRRPNLVVRHKIMQALRAVFEDRKFLEVETPILQHSPGAEVHLHAFKTAFKDPHGGADTPFYLHTSPEFAMKKLLVAGEERLFQFAHTFRNAERSSRHHPEFIMLEWYRAHGSTEDLKEDCIHLVRAAASAAIIERGLDADQFLFKANGMQCDPFADWVSLSVPDAFLHYADIDLLATAPDPLNPDTALLRQAAIPLGLRLADDDRWEDIFFRIMMEKIEPFLGKDKPTFLCDYPISMAALARPNPDDPRLAERFELYMAGYEIANAFGELTDADEQERRFKFDMALKQEIYGECFPVDTDFINALRHGMPSSAGIALGVDRLIMLCAGVEHIEDVLWLPVTSC